MTARAGAVTDAKASLYNPDTALRQESQVGATGKFTFQNLPAGAYILRVDKPGYAPVLEEFNLAQDANHVQGTVILWMLISAEGVPKHIQVTSSPSDHLSESALETVRQMALQFDVAQRTTCGSINRGGRELYNSALRYQQGVKNIRALAEELCRVFSLDTTDIDLK